MDLHQEIRKLAQKHVSLAEREQRETFSIAVRELMSEAEAEGISTAQRVPAFCRAIQTAKFSRENGLTITEVEGPKSGLSTTVVVHYRRTGSPTRSAGRAETILLPSESPAEKASRLAGRLRGLIREEIASRGGAEEFLRWVRSDENVA
jgi:hypothetical protein